jgi:hypothetical protein
MFENSGKWTYQTDFDRLCLFGKRFTPGWVRICSLLPRRSS